MARTEPEQQVRDEPRRDEQVRDQSARDDRAQDEQGRDEQARRGRLRDEAACGGRTRADGRPTRDEAPRTDRPGDEKSRADHPRDPRAPLRPPLGLLVATGAVLLVASVALAVTIGPAHLALGEVSRSVASHLGLRVAPVPTLHDAIVWDLRLPRALTAAAVGAGLALAGAVMQSLTRNPLADPYLLGLSSGASLGAAAVLLLGVAVLLPVAAFAGAMLALLAALSLARVGGTLTPTRAVLAGLAISQLAAAATSFVIFWTARGDSYQEIVAWLLGSLAATTWSSVAIAAGALVVASLVVVAAAGRLDAFAFGDTAAASLGVDPNRTRWFLMGVVALLTGALVSVSGSIGFVGLLVPHAVSPLTGPSHRRLLPVAALAGGVLLVWADTLARTVFAPRELPVGIVTALLGAPVFAWLLRRGRGAAWS